MKAFYPNWYIFRRYLGWFQLAEVTIVVSSIAIAVWAVYFRSSCGG